MSSRPLGGVCVAIRILCHMGEGSGSCGVEGACEWARVI